MSGLLALLDDVAGIAKVAAASVDDVAGMTAKAGAKVSGVVIDDAAVTPAYVTGFSADRELPIIWKIARGSIFNKLVILLPIALGLSAFAPWAISPLLMLGGAYLCFEGAEKVWHALHPGAPHADGHVESEGDPAHLEQERVAGAIKTDFILSAEIMTIALASLPGTQTIWMQAATLVAVAIFITMSPRLKNATADTIETMATRLADESPCGAAVSSEGARMGRGEVASKEGPARSAGAMFLREAREPGKGPARRAHPPVTLMCRPTAGRDVARSITKSCPFGLRAIALSMAA
jgi:predicted DNA repair protein MutK